MASLEYDLVDSAMAFLARSVQTINDSDDEHSVAFAVVDLAAAVEVLMKARLMRADWTQVCSMPTSSFADLTSGAARTVAPDEAAARLDAVAVVDIAGHRNSIGRLARLRNRAVHFTLTNGGEQPAGVRAEYGGGLDFVLWFLNSEFRDRAVCGVDIVVVVDEVIEELTQVVGQIRGLVESRMMTLAPELADAAVRLVCPRCAQPALLMPGGRTPRCAFCLWTSDDGCSAAQEYVDAVLDVSEYVVAKNGATWPIGWCPDCEAEALVEGIEPAQQETSNKLAVMHGDAPTPAYWGCFNCGETADATEIERCSRCEIATKVTTDAGVPICTDCFAAVCSD
jgi:hypothetical protein